MASYNRVILLGNLTRDPELRYTPSGTAVTEVGLAVNDKRKGANGEWIEETTFVDITLWGRTAEVATEYLNKGAPVMIEGRLKYDQWQDKDGQKRSKLRVVGERMQMLGTKGSGGGGGHGGGGGSHAAAGGRSASRAPAYDESEYGASSDHYGDSGGAPSAGHPPEDEIPF